MIQNLNENIDLNLKLLFRQKQHKLYLSDFQNVENEHYMLHDLEVFADEMVDSDLIRRNKEVCTLTKFGIQVSESGGWLKYLSESEKQYDEENQIEDHKNQLEIQILELQKDKFEFEKSNRKKDEEIKNLTQKNLVLQNKSLKRSFLFFVIGLLLGFVFTFVSTNWKWILELFEK